MDLIYKIQKTIEYIENHLSDDINLDELASQIFCSKLHYHRINGDINIVERFRPDFEEDKITTIEMAFALK
jgi:hypothetical protein